MIVVDASVVVKWVVEEPGRPQAMRVFEIGQELIVPDLAFAEIANVLRKKVLSLEISADHATRAIMELGDLPLTVLSSSQLASEALKLALDMNHSAYDCFYLACAVGAGTLVTADEIFANKCRARGFGAAVISLSNIEAVITDRSKTDTQLISDVSRLAERVKGTFDALRSVAQRDGAKLEFIPGEVFLPAFDSPAYRRLSEVLKSQPVEQIALLVALGWLGRSYHRASQWDDLLANARSLVGRGVDNNLRYIIAQMSLVSHGLEKLRISATSQSEG